MSKLSNIFSSGKNPKWLYFAKCYLRKLIPNAFFRHRLERKLKNAEKRSDYGYIKERVDYYCQLACNTPLPADTPTLHSATKMGHKAYRFDTEEFTRWFNQELKMKFLPGDITKVPEVPSVLKSRPINGNIANSVLMKLNKVRHFIFVNDQTPFTQKKDMAVFRGKVEGKKLRREFMHKFFGNKMMDLGDISKRSKDPDEWKTGKLTIAQHLRYKFVLALEGNDVASNLKWVMSSNSIAVTPRMKYETWFMEGKLIPNYHYIEVKDDFSDLEEKLLYYTSHPEEAQQIIDHAHEYVAQFRDQEREEIIGLMVMRKYFGMTGQL